MDDDERIASSLLFMSASSARCYRLKSSDYAPIFSSVQLNYLLSLFREHDFDIRLVGGAVRDLLLGVSPHDIDLATNATTAEMLELIHGDSNIELVYTRAEQFGTLTLVVGTTERVSDERATTSECRTCVCRKPSK